MVPNVNFLLLCLYQIQYPCQCHLSCAELQCSSLLTRLLCLGRPWARSLASQPVSRSWPYREVCLSLFVMALKFLLLPLLSASPRLPYASPPQLSVFALRALSALRLVVSHRLLALDQPDPGWPLATRGSESTVGCVPSVTKSASTY